METKENQLFHTLDESSKLLVKKLKMSYLESLIHSAENIMESDKIYDEEDLLSKDDIKKLNDLYQEIDLEKLAPEKIRKAMQLALLRGMKEDYVQANHQMTPDSLGNLIAYLIEIIVEPVGEIHLADLSIGTANLLLTIHHFLKQSKNRKIRLSGVDNDELMIALASTNSALQRTPIDLQYQDALSNILMQPADLMVSDLPVGYYPLDERAAKFETSFPEKDEKSYSHYLLIEQALNYLKESAYGFFLLPSHLFNDEKVKKLVNYLNKVAYIQGIIELPNELFANEASRKSVMVIQKKGPDAHQMEVLVSKAPNFKDFEAMKLFLGEINEWKEKTSN